MSNVSLYEPFYEFERFLDDALSPFAAGAQNQLQRRRGDESAIVRSCKPRMDLHEDREKNLVTATFEFPGVAKEDIQIDVHNGRLSVSTETKKPSEQDEAGYAVRERRWGKYSRTLQLPQGVKEEEIKASMANGILTVTFPKSTPEQAPKKITIN